MKTNEETIKEEKEKAKIAWENKMLAIFMPLVGLFALVIGLVGFLLVVEHSVIIAVFLMILAALGLGGIAYGVVAFIQKRHNKNKKEENLPEDK